MKCRIRLTMTFIVPALFYLIFSRTAYAYIELGSASFILQLIIGALIGGLFAARVFWNKIKIFFKKLISKKKKYED